MRAATLRSFASAGIAAVLLSSCVYTHTSSVPKTEHYVSPTIEGASQRINLEEVEKAFFSTKGNDLNSWMSAFEKRVNEIYEGKEIVSIDATKETGKLQVTGFVESNKQPGFQQGEDKLFGLEQTGDVVDNKMPYRVTDERGQSYHEGHYSLFDNPFIQALVIGNLLSGAFGPRYYTPFSHMTVLHDYRSSYRNTPAFGSQKVANQTFNSRFKQRAITGTGVRSNNSWGRSTGYSRPSTGYSRPSGGFGTGRSWGRSGGGFGRSWGGRRR